MFIAILTKCMCLQWIHGASFSARRHPVLDEPGRSD
jgi:hypothetical protein